MNEQETSKLSEVEAMLYQTANKALLVVAALRGIPYVDNTEGLIQNLARLVSDIEHEVLEAHYQVMDLRTRGEKDQPEKVGEAHNPEA
jgi:hypothetical protein